MKTFEQFTHKDFFEEISLNFKDFNLSDSQFDHESTVHGVNHVFRVMLYTLVIGRDTGDIKTTRRSFMAAYIHDLARQHDDACLMHGPDSIKLKFPIYKDLFIANGADEDDLRAIKLAVANHCQHFEIEKTNPYYKTVALLRDSDGLDLVRLDRVVNPNILRLEESKKYIRKADRLFEKTDDKFYSSFDTFMKENINLL